MLLACDVVAVLDMLCASVAGPVMTAAEPQYVETQRSLIVCSVAECTGVRAARPFLHELSADCAATGGAGGV